MDVFDQQNPDETPSWFQHLRSFADLPDNLRSGSNDAGAAAIASADVNSSMKLEMPNQVWCWVCQWIYHTHLDRYVVIFGTLSASALLGISSLHGEDLFLGTERFFQLSKFGSGWHCSFCFQYYRSFRLSWASGYINTQLHDYLLSKKAEVKLTKPPSPPKK